MSEKPSKPSYKEMYPTNHLLILTPGNPFRKFCVFITTSKAFDVFIMLTIVVNCIIMAMNTHLPAGDQSSLNKTINSLEIYLLGIFIGEAFFKIITQGVILHPNSYFRSAWNLLDFIVIVTGILASPLTNLRAAEPVKALKACRVLRPLKLISNVPSLQVVISAMLKSMASLLQISLLIGFVIVIYAIFGLSFLIGKFHYTCFNVTNPDTIPVEKYIVNPGRLCGSLKCPEGTKCLEYWDGPNHGITNYDNIFSACLTIFTCITCEGWTDTMYWTFDVIDEQGLWTWLFYYTLNIIGSQFMLNLVLGVLSGEFSKEKDRVENRAEFLKQRNEQSSIERAIQKRIEWLKKGEEIVMKEKNERKEETEKVGGSDEPAFKDPYHVFSYLKMNAYRRFQFRNKLTRVKLEKFMFSKWMFWVEMSLVFLNSFFTGIQHYRQPQWITDVTAITLYLSLCGFFSEMCLKMYAIGPSEYFKSKWNTFDFVVVVLEICSLAMLKAFGVNLGIYVLRQLRLMRLFKFTKHYKAMKNLAASIINSMSSVLSLVVILFIFLMIFALLGMNMFAGGFYGREGKVPSRTNFNDFFNAMFAVFQIITGEDWNFVMYEGIVAYGGPRSIKGLAVSLYFVGVTVLGNYVLLNVFLAIAVDNISLDDADEKENAKVEAEREEHVAEVNEKYRPKTSALANKDDDGVVSKDKKDKNKDRKVRFSSKKDKAYGVDLNPGQVMGEFDTIPIEGGHAQPGEDILENLKNPGRMTGNIPQAAGSGMLQVNTLFICFPNNPIRKVVHSIVTSQYFDNIILVLILISSGLLAAEDTTNPDADINKVLTYANFFFTSVFALEVILKIVNFGFCLHPDSYCRDAWNCVDMFVVICSITSLALSQDANANSTVKSIVKILRILRVLRPLKSINKLPKLKAVLQCMIYSLKNVLNIWIITVQFLIIFAMIGVQLFSGKFYFCNDLSKELEEDCQGDFITFENENYNRPKQRSRTWSNQDFNFDNIFEALITLFTASTGEGWPAIMQSGIDSQGKGQGPLLDNKIYISVYFLTFVIIMSFFFLNVFVGMIILTFQELNTDSNESFDRNTKRSFVFAMNSKPLKRYMPKDVKSLQYKAWELIETNLWEYLISALIVANTAVLMTDFHDQPKDEEKLLDRLNEMFTFLFLVEFLIKFFALGFNYFKDGWNNFDAIIVAVSLIDFIINELSRETSKGFDPSIFRLFRALRLVKLLRRSRSLRILLWTFLQSFKILTYTGDAYTLLLKYGLQLALTYLVIFNIVFGCAATALPYVGMLIFLLFFVYGIIGMQIFSLISIDNDDEPWAQINRMNHFRSYFSATQVLFRVASGENWPNIMLACTGGAKCDKTLKAVKENMENCGTPFAYVYFASFVFFCSFLMMNLFVAVIMDSFAFLTEDSSILGPHHLDEFVTVWSDFDPRATGRIQHTEVCELLRQMLPPVGLGLGCPKRVAYKRLVQMNMRFYKDGTVDYTGTFFALVRTGLKVYTDEANLKTNDQAFKKMMKETWPNISKRTLDMVIPRIPKHSKHMTIAKVYTAKLIWENHKNMKKQKQQQKQQQQQQQQQQRRRSSVNPNLLSHSSKTNNEIELQQQPAHDPAHELLLGDHMLAGRHEDIVMAVERNKNIAMNIEELGEDWC